METLAYGVEWDINVSDPVLTRIGNPLLHKSLPIQSALKGCIAQGENIIKYLDPDDWDYYEDDAFNLSFTADSASFDSDTVTITSADYASEFVVGDRIYFYSYSGNVSYSAYGKVTEISGTSLTVKYTVNSGSVGSTETGPTVERLTRLNGYEGNVQIEVPEFYIWSVEDGDKRRVWISTHQCVPYARKIPHMLVDAYRSQVLNTVPSDMGYLSTLSANSVVCVMNEETYVRGGSNSSSYDYDTDDNRYRSVLNKPRTSISRSTMRTYATNAGRHLLTYDYYKSIFYWLYTIEYANFNCQATYNSELTSDGYRQGGLGNGMTTVASNWWNQYNSRLPLVPNGFGNSLGNGTGLLDLVVPETTETVTCTTFTNWSKLSSASDASITGSGYNSYGSDAIECNNVYTATYIYSALARNCSGTWNIAVEGDLTESTPIRFVSGSTTLLTVTAAGSYTVDWGTSIESRYIYCDFTGSVSFKISIVSATSGTITWPTYTFSSARWRGFDNPFGDIWTNLDGIIYDSDSDSHGDGMCYVYTCQDLDNMSDSLTEYYKKVANSIATNGYITAYDLGTDANMIANKVGGSSITYMCDYHYFGSSSTTLRTVIVGGSANSGAVAGFSYFNSSNSVSHSSASVSFRSIKILA